MSLEGKLLNRFTGVQFFLAGVLIVVAGYLPLQLYIWFGPAHGNPIGLGLLALAAVPLGAGVAVVGLVKLLIASLPRWRQVSMFDALGILLALYTAYCVTTGEVYAKSGPGGKTIRRADNPEYFWVVIVIYAGLAVALCAYF